MEGSVNPCYQWQPNATCYTYKPNGKCDTYLYNGVEYAHTGCKTLKGKQNYDLRLEDCKFLYTPGVVAVTTTSSNARGYGERVYITVKPTDGIEPQP